MIVTLTRGRGEILDAIQAHLRRKWRAAGNCRLPETVLCSLWPPRLLARLPRANPADGPQWLSNGWKGYAKSVNRRPVLFVRNGTSENPELRPRQGEVTLDGLSTIGLFLAAASPNIRVLPISAIPAQLRRSQAVASCDPPGAIAPYLGSRFSRADRHEHGNQKYHSNKVTDPRQRAVIDDAEATDNCGQDTSPQEHGDLEGIGYAQQASENRASNCLAG